MNKVLAVLLLTVLCTMRSAQTTKGDNWLVLSLDVVKTTDLVPREKIDFVTDPKFWPVDINGQACKMQRFLLGLDPATSDDKLGALKGLLKKPTELQVTVSHHGNLYRGWCWVSRIHLDDPDTPKELQNKEREHCGQLLSSYVGKTLANWPNPSSPPKASADGWTVGVTTTPEGFFSLILMQAGRPEWYTGAYLIWSVDPAKQEATR